MAKAKILDFTKVKDGGNFNKKHQAPGDYKAKVIKVEDAKSKADDEPMWLYTIQVGTGSYPYYCKLVENQLWKVRNLFIAAGINVPKKRVNVDPSKVVNRPIGVTLDDEEYEGKMQSVVAQIFPPSELEEGDEEEDDEENEEDPTVEPEDDDEDSVEESQEDDKKSKKKGKKSKKSAEDVDDNELEELEIEDI